MAKGEEIELLEHYGDGDIKIEPTSSFDCFSPNDSGIGELVDATMSEDSMSAHADTSPTQPATKVKSGAKTPPTSKTPTRSESPKAAREKLTCEFCGKEYQSMSGLKYHRDRSKSRNGGGSRGCKSAHSCQSPK